MELIIKNKVRNDMLSRDEIIAIAQSEITPRTDEVKTALAEKLGKNAELVVIKRIKGKFGSKDFFINSYIYDNLEALKRFEPKSKKEKKKKETEAEEKPAAQPKEAEEKVKKEEKAEEKKEEGKAEEIKKEGKEKPEVEEEAKKEETKESKEAGEAK